MSSQRAKGDVFLRKSNRSTTERNCPRLNSAVVGDGDIEGVTPLWSYAGESGNKSVCRAVANPGCAQRAQQRNLNPLHRIEDPGCGELVAEPKRCAHGSDGVGAGWPNTDGEEVESG